MSMTERAPAVPAWVKLLADFLSTHEGVEAIHVDATARQVRLATLGPVDSTVLQEQLNEVLRRLEEAAPSMAKQSSSPSGLNLSQEAGLIMLAKPACPTAPRFWKWREFEWPEAEAMERQSEAEWRALAVQAGLCGAALVAAWALERHWPEIPALWARVLFAVSLISGGWDAAKDAWENLRERRLDVHFLMLAVAAGAVAVGAWQEGALLLFLFSTSGALEHYVLHRTHREIHALTQAAPKLARVVLPDATTEQRAVSLLRPGDIVQVRPAELFPVDAKITQGETAADEATLDRKSVV